MSGYRAIAAMLEALAGWLDDAAAGGQPSKWLVGQAIAAVRVIAAAARAEDTAEEDQ